jgi:hypothetical protein
MVDRAGFDFVGSSGPPTPAAAIGMISAVFDFDATCNGWPRRAAAVDVAHFVPFVSRLPCRLGDEFKADRLEPQKELRIMKHPGEDTKKPHRNPPSLRRAIS